MTQKKKRKTQKRTDIQIHAIAERRQTLRDMYPDAHESVIKIIARSEVPLNSPKIPQSMMALDNCHRRINWQYQVGTELGILDFAFLSGSRDNQCEELQTVYNIAQLLDYTSWQNGAQLALIGNNLVQHYDYNRIRMHLLLYNIKQSQYRESLRAKLLFKELKIHMWLPDEWYQPCERINNIMDTWRSNLELIRYRKHEEECRRIQENRTRESSTSKRNSTTKDTVCQ